MALKVLGVRATDDVFQVEGGSGQYKRTANLWDMGDADLWVWTGAVIAKKFASVEDRGSLKVTTTGLVANHTSIGTFVDTEHNSEVGDHPIDATDTSVVNTYTFQMNTASISDGKTVRPLVYDTATDEIRETTDAELDSEIIDVLRNRWYSQTYMVGKYWLKAGTSAPAVADGAGSNTYTSRYTIDDTQTDGTTQTYTLWQDTLSAVENLTVGTGGLGRPLVKFNSDKEIVELTQAETESLVDRFRLSIDINSIGSYRLQDTAPTEAGTWQQKGDTMTDQRKTSTTVTYTGSYDGTYEGTYVGYYTGYYTGTYTGSYAADYGGFAGTSYSGDYEGTYEGTYEGSYTGSYTGTYTGDYDGLTLQSTSSTISSRKLYARTG